MTPERLRVRVGEEAVTALRYRAAAPAAGVTLIFGHGAGADQYHAFLVSFAGALASRGIEVVTFNFVYTELKRGAPDRPAKLEDCWRAVIAAVPLDGNALAIGGKSMGGRIASQIAGGVDGLRGLVFLGYPLHPPKQPDKLRAAHLKSIRPPMLFVQGERDPFGSPDELGPHLPPAARVYTVAGGDHSLRVPKRAGDQDQVYAAIQNEIKTFLISI